MILTEEMIKDLPLTSDQYHPKTTITLQDAIAHGHILLEDFDKQLRGGD